VIQIYSEGATYDEIIEKLDIKYFQDELLNAQSFKFIVDGRGRIIEKKEQLDIIDKVITYAYQLGLNGKVSMNDPERVFVLIENHRNGQKYFGKIVAGRDGNIKFNIDSSALYYSKYHLRSRKYLGPTSTDNVLAFVMVCIFLCRQILDKFNQGISSLILS
jgi:tRNA G10  N-methylase Trm11